MSRSQKSGSALAPRPFSDFLFLFPTLNALVVKRLAGSHPTRLGLVSKEGEAVRCRKAFELCWELFFTREEFRRFMPPCSLLFLDVMLVTEPIFLSCFSDFPIKAIGEQNNLSHVLGVPLSTAMWVRVQLNCWIDHFCVVLSLSSRAATNWGLSRERELQVDKAQCYSGGWLGERSADESLATDISNSTLALNEVCDLFIYTIMTNARL